MFAGNGEDNEVEDQQPKDAIENLYDNCLSLYLDWQEYENAGKEKRREKKYLDSLREAGKQSMQVVLGAAKMKERGGVDVTDVPPSVNAVVSPLVKRTEMASSQGE